MLSTLFSYLSAMMNAADALPGCVVRTGLSTITDESLQANMQPVWVQSHVIKCICTAARTVKHLVSSFIADL